VESKAEQTRAGANPAQSIEFLTVDEAAEMLRVNRKSLYQAIERGEIPGVVRIGRTLRIRRAALAA
jgi:excisionase family DNA binding protein